MTVYILPSGPLETNAYLVACPETHKAAIIDPAPGSTDAVVACIQKQRLQPTHILLTHSHWDHIADTSHLKKKYQIPVYIHSEDAENLINPGSDGLHCWVDITGVQPERLLSDGDCFSIGNLPFVVIFTPGHTPGGVCFFCSKEGLLFSGDTLFKGSIGKLSLPTGRPTLMWNSIKRLSELPADTKVYPGHGPSTTIGSEKWLSRAQEIFDQ